MKYILLMLPLILCSVRAFLCLEDLMGNDYKRKEKERKRNKIYDYEKEIENEGK